jgi:hypothetical protein
VQCCVLCCAVVCCVICGMCTDCCPLGNNIILQQPWSFQYCQGIRWSLTCKLISALSADLTTEQLAEMKGTLPMLWFDKALKGYGPLLPFFGFLIRSAPPPLPTPPAPQENLVHPILWSLQAIGHSEILPSILRFLQF